MNTDTLIPTTAPYPSDKPLPLVVAELWKFPLQHVDTEDGLFYAIEDWIAGLISEDSRRKVQNVWNTAKSKMLISTQQLPYTSSDGKTYQKEHTNDEGLYLIAQNLRVTKTRPALSDIQEYLAKAGVFADNIRTDKDATREKLLKALIAEDPDRAYDTMVDHYMGEGRDPEWIKRRLIGLVRRAIFTAVLKDTVTTSPNYPAATNAGYEGAFGMNKAQIVKHLEINNKEARKVRDFMSSIALEGITLYETASSEKMRQLGRKLTPEEQIEIVKFCAELVAPTIQQLAAYVGVDLLSGKPLLEGGAMELES